MCKHKGVGQDEGQNYVQVTTTGTSSWLPCCGGTAATDMLAVRGFPSFVGTPSCAFLFKERDGPR